ncbi:MAG: response regulator transcription factor [Bryobacteraceae bacterium]
MIRVQVAATSAVVRAGFEALLRTAPNLEITGSASDWTQLAAGDPDVVLVDWDGSGEDLPAELLELAPASAVVLLADDPQRSWTNEALRAGVRGVLPREAGANQIIAAVEAAAAGLVVLPAEELEGLLMNPRPARSIETLSPREIEVLGMVAEGSSNKAIAFRLGISEHTVKFHVTSIMTKLNAGSRTEAVTLGIRQGLVML